MPRKKKDDKIQDLEVIKRLLVLALINQGVKTDAIGVALGIDGSNVRRMIPQKLINKKQK